MTAFLVGVAPNLPGFIHSITPSIDPGVGKRPYTFAWILGFVITSLVYVVLSLIWPPKETLIERAVLPDEVYDAGDAYGVDVVEGTEKDHAGGKAWDGRVRGREGEEELAIV